jgi:hypothetical protein
VFPQIVGGNEPHGVGERGTARAEFEQDFPCEAPIMQVPNLIWSELVSHRADPFESGGCDERQPFWDWDIGHALTVRLSAPRLHRFAGDRIEGRWTYLIVPRRAFKWGETAGLAPRRRLSVRPAIEAKLGPSRSIPTSTPLSVRSSSQSIRSSAKGTAARKHGSSSAPLLSQGADWNP